MLLCRDLKPSKMKKELKVSEMDIRLMPFGNRQVSQKQVRNLKNKIVKHGIQRNLQLIYTNLFGNGYAFYIKDGQHLWMACLALGLIDELTYTVDKFQYNNSKQIVEAVADINSDQKGWRLPDFVDSFASTNDVDYTILKSKYLKYGLSYQLTAMIYGGLSATNSAKMLKAGTFKIVNEQKGDSVAIIIQDVVLLFGRSNNIFLREFTFAFYHWYNSVEYNHNEFLEFIKENKDKLSLLKANQIELLLQTVNYEEA